MNTESRYIDSPISQHFGDVDGASMYLMNDTAIKWSEDRTSIGFFPTGSREYRIHESFGVLAVVTCSDGNNVFCIDAERIWVYRDGYTNAKVIPLDDMIAVDISGPVTGCAAIAIGPGNFLISLLFAEFIVVLVIVDQILSVQVTTCIDDEKAAHMMNLAPTNMEMWFDVTISTVWIVCNDKGSELNSFSFVVNDNKPLIDEESGNLVPINRGKIHLQRQFGHLLTDENTHLSWISAVSRNINFDASVLYSISNSGGNGAYNDCFGVTGDLYGGLTVWENVLPPDEVDEDGDVIIIFGPKPYYLDSTVSYTKFGNGAIRSISVDYSTVTSQSTSFPTVWVADISGYVYCNKYDTQLKSLFRLHTVFLKGYDCIMDLYAIAIDISPDSPEGGGSYINANTNARWGGGGEGDTGGGYQFQDEEPQIEVQIIDSSAVQEQTTGGPDDQTPEFESPDGHRNINFASSVMSPLTQHQSEYMLGNKESLFGDSHSAIVRGEGDGSIVHIVDNECINVPGTQDSAAFSMKNTTEVVNPYNGYMLSVLSGTGRVGRVVLHKSAASVVSTIGPFEATDPVESLVVVNNLSFYEAFGMARNPIVVRHSTFFPLLNLLAVATSDFRVTVWHLDNFTGVHRESLVISQTFEISEVTSLTSHEMLLSDPTNGAVLTPGAPGMQLSGLLYVGYRSGRVDEYTITNQAGSRKAKPRSQTHSSADSVFSQSQDPVSIHGDSLPSENSQSTTTDAGYAQYATFAYRRPATASRMADLVHNNLPAHIASHELKQYSTMEERKDKRDAVLQRREDKKQKEAREKQEKMQREKERRRNYRHQQTKGVETRTMQSKSQGNLMDGVAAMAASSKPKAQTLRNEVSRAAATVDAEAGGTVSGRGGLPPTKPKEKESRPNKAVACAPGAGSVASGASGNLNLLELVHASSFVSRVDMNQQGEYGFTNHWTCELTHSVSFSPLPLTAIMVSKADSASAGSGLEEESITHLVLSYCMQYIVVCDRAEPSKAKMKIQLNDGSAFGMTMSRLIVPSVEPTRGQPESGSGSVFDAPQRERGVYLVLFGEKNIKLLDCLTGKIAKEFPLATEYLSFDTNDMSLSISKRSTLVASANNQGVGTCCVTLHSIAQWQMVDDSLVAPATEGASALSLVLNDKQGGVKKQELGVGGRAAFSRSSSSHSLDSSTSSTRTMPRIPVDGFIHEFVGVYVTTSGDLYSYNAATTDQFLVLNIFTPQMGESYSQSQFSQGPHVKSPADRLIQGMSVFTDSITSPLVLIWTLHCLYTLRLSFELPPPASHLQSGTVSRSFVSPDKGHQFGSSGLHNSQSEAGFASEGIGVEEQFDSFNGGEHDGHLGQDSRLNRGMKNLTFSSAEGAGAGDVPQVPSYEPKVVRFVRYDLLAPELMQPPGATGPQYRQCRARIVHAAPMKHPEFEDMGTTTGDVVYDHTRVHKVVILLSDGTIQVLQY